MADIAAIFGGPSADTFLGLPPGDLSQPGGGVAILGVPVATPYAVTGAYASGAPQAIRVALAGEAGARQHHDFDFDGPLLGEPEAPAVDYGNLVGNPDDGPGNRAAIESAIRAIRSAGGRPLVLGGDDSVPIPVLAGFSGEAPIWVLQIDAHIDWRDEVAGERFGLSSNMRRSSEMAHIAGIVQVGARAVGSARPADLADAKAWGATFIPARAVHDGGGLAAAVEAIPEGVPLYINLDVDALDPSQMPAVIGPAPGGLWFHQVTELIAAVAARARLVGASVVEFTPDRDPTGLAAFTAGRLACHLLARLARAKNSSDFG